LSELFCEIVNKAKECGNLCLYRNEFKNWEFGKEAARDFGVWSEATIAERQGASEDPKYAAKPMRPKTNS